MNETKSAEDKIDLWPLLYVRDLKRSIAFYCDRLGFQLVDKAESGSKIFWCRLVRQSCSLMLQQAESEDEPATHRGRGVLFYFVCQDADRIHAELTERGLSLPPPETAYYGMRQVHVPDPDGYRLCFESPT
jgi:uncharacterized glyoxalase superfamily protein PhnB